MKPSFYTKCFQGDMDWQLLVDYFLLIISVY